MTSRKIKKSLFPQPLFRLGIFSIELVFLVVLSIFSFSSEVLAAKDINIGQAGDSVKVLTNFCLGGSCRSSWLWNTSGTSAYYSGGNVGIGVSSPTTMLQIGDNAINPTILLASTGAGDVNTAQSAGIEFGESPGARGSIWYTGDGYMHIGMNNRSREHMRFQYSANNSWVYGNLYLNSASNNTYFPGSSIWNKSGNVGIGTTAPTSRITVDNSVVSANYSLDAGNQRIGGVADPTPSNPKDVVTVGYLASSIGTVAPGGASSTWSVSGTNIYNKNTGNVGIGVSSPTIARLQVSAVNNIEGLRIVSSNYSPLVIRNTANNADLMRLSQAGSLELASSLKISDTTIDCNAANSGTFKHDSVSGQSYVCDGKKWLNQKNCGVVSDEDGNSYGTVQIGGQCWMTENMRVGTMLASGSTQPSADNQIIEKWCYGDASGNCVASNCETYGGLYSWDEAMRGSRVAGAQGICPSGWHIPTDAELNILEKNILGVISSSLSQYPCSIAEAGWQRCADVSGGDAGGVSGVGRSIKAVGQGGGNGAGNDLVGFKGVLSGYRNTNSSFYYLGSYLALWSSSESSASNAWRRGFNTSYSSVNRNGYNKGNGFSVRCLAN